MSVKSIPAAIFHNAQTRPDKPAYYAKVNGSWEPTSFARYAGEVRSAAKSLHALGLQKGQTITILGFNRPEWIIADVAAMCIGSVAAGIYTTNSPAECRYIMEHAETPVIFLENAGQWAKVREVRDQLPALRTVVMMKGADPIDDPNVLSWDEFMALGEDVDDSVVSDAIAALQPDDLATLIYTSGTTGPPKGVMLSVDNLYFTASRAIKLFGLNDTDSGISYLPLSHIAEQTFTIHGPTLAGWPVYFAESIDALPVNLTEARPTIFFAVPRVWERFHTGVAAKLAEATGVKAKLAAWAMGVGSKVSHLKLEGKEPSGALAVQYSIADKLVLGKIKAALGLDRVRFAAVGAAPISVEVLEFMASLDVVIWEIYGQSEDTGPTTVSSPGKAKFGAVGAPYPDTEVKIADDGEILVKGRNVFMGYFRQPEETAATLKDGWLYSGDLGAFGADGLLTITGRKKDIIITAGGKNVAPKPFESGMKDHPLVAEAVLIGDRRKFLSALVTLDEEGAAAFMDSKGLTGAPHTCDEIRSSIQDKVDALNKNFARVEQIKKFAILGRQLSIEGGELTPTLKVKRNKVTEHFSNEIEDMYAG
jgi:long-chain acyl-CoA synthetase